MKKQFVILLLLISTIAAQDTLITINGIKYVGKYIETKDSYIYFQPQGIKFPQGIREDRVAAVYLIGGQIITKNKNETGNKEIFNLDTLIQKTDNLSQNEPMDYFNLGAGMIIVSGIVGLVASNLNTETNNMDELERILDRQKTLMNIHYLLLITGAFIMIIDHNGKIDPGEE